MVTLILQPAALAYSNNDLVAIGETNIAVRFLKFELFHINSGNIKIFELNQFPNPITKRAAFNFKHIAASFFKPSFSTNLVTAQPGLVQQFFFKYTEINNDNTVGNIATSNTFTIVYGSNANEGSVPTDNIIPVADKCGLFLNLPRTIVPIRFDHDFFINYLHTELDGNPELHIKFIYTDATFDVYNPTFDVIQNKLYTINVCNSLVINEADPLKVLSKIEIQIINVLKDSGILTLIYDHTHIYKLFAWHFLSSCGGWQTIAFKGDFETILQRTFEESEMSKDFLGSLIDDVYPNASNNVVFPSGQVHSIKTNYTYKGDLGYQADVLSQRTMIDLITSPLIVQRFNNKLMQVLITSQNIPLGNKSNSKPSIPVEWKYAHSNLTPKNYIV